MKSAKMSIIKFDANDVIATSAVTFTISGIGDNNYQTFGFKSSDGTYDYSSASTLSISGQDILNKKFYVSSTYGEKTLSAIIETQSFAESDKDGGLDALNDSYNGTYIWNTTESRYEKQ